MHREQRPTVFNRLVISRLVISRLVISAFCGMVAFAGCGKAAEEKADSDGTPPVVVEMATSTSKAVEITVTAQGTLSPAQGASVRVSSPIAGRLTEIKVREGDRVTQNQLLAIVDNRPQQAAARSARVAVTVANVQAKSANLAAQAAAIDQSGAVRTATLALDAATIDKNAQVRLAQNSLDSAQTDLARLKAGARPQEIAQAQQAVTQAEATRARAQTELERVQFLFDKGIAARRQLDDASTSVAVTNSALTSAREALSLITAGARKEEIRSAELRVEAARETLAQAQKSGDARIAQASAALKQAEQSRLQVAVKQEDAKAMRDMSAQKQADLAAAQATVAIGELRAPIEGTVTKRTANPGDIADPATPFLEISNPNGLNLIANLPAEDGLKIRAGMGAHITSTEVPDKTFAGRVLSIGQVDPTTNLLSVRLVVANPDKSLRSGAFATAAIVLQQIPQALVVPKSAVVTQDEKQVIFTVDKEGVAHAHKITTGPEIDGGKQIAILTGLNSDSPVVVTGNYELTDGAKTKPAEAKAGAK